MTGRRDPILAHEMGPGRETDRVLDQIATVAPTNFTVLVIGETGTGKELAARAVHRQSDRSGRPCNAIDCGAIPEQLLESILFGHEKGAFTGADRSKRGEFDLAEGGTLFLDEVGNLPLGPQAKLLRALESREIASVGGTTRRPMDIRFVAATNVDLKERVATGHFRSDLYFRLAQFTVVMPPLRERREAIPYLAQRFLGEISEELRRATPAISDEAMAILLEYPWPGNVRELRNVVRQAALRTRGSVVRRAAVEMHDADRNVSSAAVVSPGRSLKEISESAAREAERVAIRNALRAAHGNKAQAARALQTDYKTLHVKMKAFGLGAKDFLP